MEARLGLPVGTIRYLDFLSPCATNEDQIRTPSGGDQGTLLVRFGERKAGATFANMNCCDKRGGGGGWRVQINRDMAYGILPLGYLSY